MASTKPVAQGRGVLPAEMTSFVGRRRELAETRRMLAGSRLLTLTGPGGVGKTRLALRMATEVRRTFPDGVWFVELAALRDPQLLPHTLANALELRQVSADPAADLASYLEPQRLLVVLDNCEHLTDACAVLASKLLAAAPELRILATSRHVLGVEGEQILSVPPLSVPEEDRDVLAGDATHYESVTLFLDRATAVAPGFAITERNRSTVVELCRRLDGIPLAIELAAVWLRILSPAQILDRLEDRFRLLTGGRRAAAARQQALDATVGWSYDLCSPTEQVMWTRLSVFSGGFDLEGAEAVCAGDGIDRDEVLGLVAGLVNKSIVVRHQATEHTTAWYQMLESIRQYGAERLTDDQARELRVRHRDHYRSVANGFAEEGFGPHQADWFIRLRRESGNLRAAIEFCLAEPGEAAGALEIAAPLWNFWFAGFLREGYRYLRRALELATEPPAIRAHGLFAASYLAMFATDFERNATMLAECTQIAAGLDDDLLDAQIKECRGQATLYQGDLPGAIELLEQARREYQAIGNALGEFDTLILLSACTFFLDDPRVDEFSRQALALAEHHGAQSSTAYALWSVGIAQWRAGDFDEATRSLRRSIRKFLPMHDLTGISFGVQALSWCAAFADPGERAARLLGAAQAVWRTSGAKVDETNAYSVFDTRSEDALRDAIGSGAFDSEQFQRAIAEGASYSFEQAVALALGEDDDADRSEDTVATPARPSGEKPGGLTPREWEIAQLLGEGLSNKEIADRLVISLRTAETHVERILSKLGFTSRLQVPSWVADQQAR